MTKQIIHPQQQTSIVGCRQCAHFRPAEVYQLCAHPKSEYSLIGEIELHTCAHMRGEDGLCGTEMRLRK